jgi:hypothetical protein
LICPALSWEPRSPRTRKPEEQNYRSIDPQHPTPRAKNWQITWCWRAAGLNAGDQEPRRHGAARSLAGEDCGDLQSWWCWGDTASWPHRDRVASRQVTQPSFTFPSVP